MSHGRHGRRNDDGCRASGEAETAHEKILSRLQGRYRPLRAAFSCGKGWCADRRRRGLASEAGKLALPWPQLLADSRQKEAQCRKFRRSGEARRAGAEVPGRTERAIRALLLVIPWAAGGMIADAENAEAG